MSFLAGLASALSGPIGAILALFGVGFMFSAMSNLIGSATGQNPTAQASATMMQTLLPMMVSIMPLIMVMNMMMGMMNAIMQPFERLTRPMVPTYTYMV